MSEITRILNLIESGASNAANELFPLVYHELRKMAARKISHETPGQTLDATGLVHEAFLRLVDKQSFQSRRHFLAAASEAMRRILVDRARARKASKRGGGIHRADIQPDQIGDPQNDARLLQLDQSLTRFSEIEPEKSELVKLRYFAGLTIKQAAETLEISTATADRYWAYAKAWLQTDIEENPIL